MAQKDNIKALLSNTKTRVILLFTIIVIIVAIVIAFFQLRGTTEGDVETGARLKGAPGAIRSIPGQLDPTQQYAELVEQRNIEQAMQAQQKGGSAIPTIIRTQAFGEGEVVGPQGGEGGVGFATLALQDISGTQKSLWLQSLKDANCNKETISKVTTQGASLRDIKEVCTCAQLQSAGIGFTELKNVCSCGELRMMGITATQMKQAGLTARELRTCGFSACELKGAGFSAQEMLDGGYSRDELKGAGFPDTEIERAGGLPPGMSADDVRQAGCNPDALRRLKSRGVSASAIRRISGCSLSQLKAAGFNAQDLKAAGFSAAELKNAGFTPEQLRAGGFSARELLDAGFNSDDLAKAGYSPVEIQQGEANLPPDVNAGMIKQAGCDSGAIRRLRLAGVSAQQIREQAGCSATALKQGGFSDADLQNAGFTPEQIKGAQAAVPDSAIREAGCDPAKLRALYNQGVSAKRIKDLNGCSAQALKNAGFDIKALTDAGFTPTELSAAGFTADEIKNALESVGDDVVSAAGCDPEKIKALAAQGISAKRIRDLNGCSADALRKAGFGIKDLAEAGFNEDELKAAGFSPDEINALKAYTSNAEKIGPAGCDPTKLRSLRDQGITAKEIRDQNNCTLEDLKRAGFDPKALADAGFSPQELLGSGLSPEQMAAQGLNPTAVIASGRAADCSVESLKAAKAIGTSAATIRQTLGCPLEALKAAGFTADELRNAGFTAKELKDAGFGINDLKAAGFGARDLKAAGFSANDLKNAGFSPEQLKEAGFGAKELKDAGYSANDLKKAGFTDEELKDAGFESAVAALRPAAPAPVAPSQVAALPKIEQKQEAQAQAQAQAQQLQEILKRQQTQMADQKSQQKLQQRTQVMQNFATQAMNAWKNVPTQVYVASSIKEEDEAQAKASQIASVAVKGQQQGVLVQGKEEGSGQIFIKTGDVMFGVIDTSVNSDEPGPILATIVSGRLKGGKLIGSFNLPSNADKMIISFNTLSMPGIPRTIPVQAYAIDPNTARTALSSVTNHHYLQRYGSLFAATFLEGFGNAFQAADTTITIGGTGGVTNTTVQSGIGRSILENAVIGLATLGKAWGQVAQQQFNRPTTVEVCSGTGIGILFTQDVAVG